MPDLPAISLVEESYGAVPSGAPAVVSPARPHAKRNHSIQALRGVAAAGVMLAHFYQGLIPVTHYGMLGVWVFFAISGFVIPYAMASSNYASLADAKQFLLRRIVRLEPPYIASVLIAAASAYAATKSGAHRGEPFDPTAGEFLAQFFYIGPWLNIAFINSVAWTLAIEFQYYLLMLVCAPLLISQRRSLRMAFYAGALALPFLIPDGRTVFHFLPAFGMGFSAFSYHRGDISRGVLFVLWAAIAASLVHAIPQMIATLAAGVIILLPLDRPIPVLGALGTISYSLYLIHLPIGQRIVNLAVRLPTMESQVVVLIAAPVISLVFAAVFWNWIERPFHERARTIGIPAKT